MRAGWCEPGTAIVAGPSLPEAPDLFLGWAFQIKRRWGRTVVIDEDDREWHGGVTVIPPGDIGCVWRCRAWCATRPRGCNNRYRRCLSLATSDLYGLPAYPAGWRVGQAPQTKRTRSAFTERALLARRAEPSPADGASRHQPTSQRLTRRFTRSENRWSTTKCRISGQAGNGRVGIAWHGTAKRPSYLGQGVRRASADYQIGFRDCHLSGLSPTLM